MDNKIYSDCDFCIIRNDYGGENYLYAMTKNLEEAQKFIAEFRDKLVNPAIEVCSGSFPLNAQTIDVIIDL